MVDVLQIIDPNTGLPTTAGWEKASGTSYAAPAAATMGVLLKEACGGTINHMFLRAIMMTGAWGINPHGTKYSTPGTGDQRDGAGAPLSDDLLMFCLGGGGGLRTKGGVFIVDLERGDDAPDRAFADVAHQHSRHTANTGQRRKREKGRDGGFPGPSGARGCPLRRG